jgi:hypothetical protein
VIQLLRKLTLLAAVVVAALAMSQAAVAKKGGHSPNGNAWGGSGLVDGR